MTYGLGSRASVEDSPVEAIASLRQSRSPIRSWRTLSEGCRFELIEQAVRAANDRIDGYPIAL